MKPQEKPELRVVAVISLHLDSAEWPMEDVKTLLNQLRKGSLRLWDLRWEPALQSYSHLQAMVGLYRAPSTLVTTDLALTQVTSKNLLNALEPLKTLLSPRVVKAVVQTYEVDLADA